MDGPVYLVGGLFPLPFPDGLPVVLGAFAGFPDFAMVENGLAWCRRIQHARFCLSQL